MFTIKSELTVTFFVMIGVIFILFSISTEADADDYDDDTELKFIWTPASGDVDHYDVYVSTDGSDYVLVGSTTETFYIVEGEDGHTYRVKVEAVDAAGNVGPMSDESDPVICDTSPSESVTDLRASVSGNNILLEWTAPEDSVSYNIYRDTEPGFTTGGSNRIAADVNDEDLVTTGIQWTDTGDGVVLVGDTNSNYFYVITAVDAAGNESGPSNRVGEFDIELVAGTENLISLPLTPFEDYTSYSFIQDISISTPPPSQVSRFNSSTQSCEAVDHNGSEISGLNFSIIGEGEGYSVKVSSDVVYTFTGNVITTPMTLTLKQGNNLVGVPYSTEEYTSHDLILAIPNCMRIMKYNVDTLSWEATSLDRNHRAAGANFDIRAGEGYYVYVMSNTSWTPDTPGAPITVPKRTTLAQNYPNPSNPETWIPFQLATESEVNIRIYNATGRLVKTLRLGYKPAGIYLETSKAAYWDGRNDLGEKVASGVYFYELRTETVRDIRKMILLK
jgi:fibronectin type 3 domain-containing protein